MQLNHFANRVDRRHFETVVEIFMQHLGFIKLRNAERSTHLRQPGHNIDLQFSRSDTSHRDPDKRFSQVSFLSDEPKTALEDLAVWFQERGLDTTIGSYSDKEFYLDVPDAFVDFVIEAMTPDCAEYDI